jgi:predicted Rossmann fold flavoprotein
MENSYDVVVAGGGASGLAAAVEAARAGASVLVLEKNHVPGRKILSTGAGKCNFSNAKVTPSRYHPPAAAFLRKTFAALPPARVHAFFEGLGLLWTADEKGRLFPRSMKAQDVVSALANELAFRGGQIRTLTEVTAISPAGEGLAVEACRVPPQWEKKAARGEKTVFRARRAVLAAGSPCYPQIGGSSAGYDLLRAAGHAVSAPRPVMVPLKSPEPFLKELDGVRAEAALTLSLDGAALADSRGELLFTSYGLSGPAVLDLSRAVSDAAGEGELAVEADLFPDLKPEKFYRMMTERAEAFKGRPLRHFACGLLNEKLMKAAAARCALPLEAPLPEESALELAALLKGFPVKVTGTLGFDDAMVAAGGCSLAEVDPATFASKKLKGLYVTGELLDLDGDSGGYNLHLAWTSGMLAGRSAAAK